MKDKLKQVIETLRTEKLTDQQFLLLAEILIEQVIEIRKVVLNDKKNS
jgi:hypothetical protein